MSWVLSYIYNINLSDTKQQELQQRIETKAKQEQEKKSKAKKKGKQEGETTETIELAKSENIQIPDQTATMPRGNRGYRNDDDGDDERQDERNQYWSLRDIPKFEGER